MGGDHLIPKESGCNAPFHWYRAPIPGNECRFEELDGLATDCPGELDLAVFHEVRVDDVPDDHVGEVVSAVAERGPPRPVDELEGAIRANALDHVRRVPGDSLVALFDLDEPEIDGRGVFLNHEGLHVKSAARISREWNGLRFGGPEWVFYFIGPTASREMAPEAQTVGRCMPRGET